MLSVIWGGNRGEGKRRDLGHLPGKWVIIYTRHVVVSLSSMFIAVKTGYMLLPSPNLPFISFVLVLNGYKQLPNLSGTHGLAPQCWCLLPWWWGYQETSTHESRGKVLSGYRISRQAIVVCKVKISGNGRGGCSAITVIILSFPFYSCVYWKLIGAVKLFTIISLQYLCTFVSELSVKVKSKNSSMNREQLLTVC